MITRFVLQVQTNINVYLFNGCHVFLSAEKNDFISTYKREFTHFFCNMSVIQTILGISVSSSTCEVNSGFSLMSRAS